MVNILKYSGQNSKLIQESAILMTFERHSLFLVMNFQYHHDILLGSGAEVSMHF